MVMEQTRLSSALRRFKELYGEGEVRAMRAPARINIIGEHVDYVPDKSMASLAFASREHAMLMLFRASDERVVRGASTIEKFPPFRFAIDEEELGNPGRRRIGAIMSKAQSVLRAGSTARASRAVSTS